MESRIGEVADGTTNWLPFILAIVFVLVDGTVFAVQSVSPGTQDFGNPWGSGPSLSKSELMTRTVDDRQTTMFPHQILQRQESEGLMGSMIQRQLYCQATELPPNECPSNEEFSDGEFNDTAHNIILSRSFILEVIHSGNQISTSQGVTDGSLSVEQENVRHQYRLPLPGGRRASIVLQVGGYTSGGVLW